MANAGRRRAVLGCVVVLAVVLALALAPGMAPAAAEEGDPLLATVDRPARIETTAEALGASTGATSRRVVVSVTHYHPTDDGAPVEAVVTASVAGGDERDLGRFGITPDRPFTSTRPATTQRFGFALPPELAAALAAGKPVTFSVRLVPVRGEGKGAALRVGAVEFR